MRNINFEIKTLKRLASDLCYNIEIKGNGEVQMWQDIEKDNDYTYENTAMALLNWYDIMVHLQQEFGDWKTEIKYIESLLLK